MSERHPLSIGFDPRPIPIGAGTSITLKADPTSDEAWGRLIGMGADLGDIDKDNPEQVAGLVTRIKDVLGAFVVDGKDEWQALDWGLIGFSQLLAGYVKEVTGGIPTPPS